MMKLSVLLILATMLPTTGTNAYSSDNGENQAPLSVSVDRSKAVGEIPFTSGVSPSGAMTYNVPIEVYPGIGGFQPQLSLIYSHLAGNGPLGAGWSLSGLSTISRTTKNPYYDGSANGINISPADAFTLDGMRLIKLSETPSKIKYETEQGNIKVNATVRIGALSRPYIEYFEVFYPDGSKGIYGYMNVISANRLYYPLTKLSDVWGNTITYNYTFGQNHYKINSITYNEVTVKFDYASRSDILGRYEAGLKIEED